MKTIKKFKLGDPVPDNSVLVRTQIVKERYSTKELYKMRWPGLGPVPTKDVGYVWYEINLEQPK